MGAFVHALPLSLQKKTMRYHRWEDRQSALLGKLLLLKGLVALGEDAGLVHDMAYDDYQRPFIPKGIDFNISHTRGMVVCALLQGGRVGIDVEAVILSKFNTWKWRNC